MTKKKNLYPQNRFYNNHYDFGLDDLNLTYSAYLLAGRICALTQNGSHSCYIKYGVTRLPNKMDKSTLKRALKELKEAGVILYTVEGFGSDKQREVSYIFDCQLVQNDHIEEVKTNSNKGQNELNNKTNLNPLSIYKTDNKERINRECDPLPQDSINEQDYRAVIHVAKRPSGCTFEQDPDVQNTLAVSGSMPAVNAAGAYEHKERGVSPYPPFFFQTLDWSIYAFNQVKRHICTQYPDLYSMSEIELKAMASRFYSAKLETNRIRNGQAAYIEIESWLAQYKKQKTESTNSNRPLDQTTRLNNLARCLSERGEMMTFSQDNVVNADYEVIDDGVTDKHHLVCNKVNV